MNGHTVAMTDPTDPTSFTVNQGDLDMARDLLRHSRANRYSTNYSLPSIPASAAPRMIWTLAHIVGVLAEALSNLKPGNPPPDEILDLTIASLAWPDSRLRLVDEPPDDDA